MRSLAGIIGAFVGAIVGVSCVVFLAFLTCGGDDFDIAFAVAFFGWIGLLIGAVGGIVLALLVLRYLKRNDLEAARRKKVLLVTGLVLGIPCLVIGMLWGALNTNNNKPPPDKELLANFQRHQAVFNQLAQMAEQDRGLKQMSDDWTEPDDPQSIGVTPARLGQYRKLLVLAGTNSSFGADADSVAFHYWYHGSAISSDTDKGYVYSKKPLTPLLASLDGCHPADTEKEMVSYRHIQGNWYLYYQYIPG